MSDFARLCLVTGIIDGISSVSTLALYATGVTATVIRVLGYLGLASLGISQHVPSREQCWIYED